MINTGFSTNFSKPLAFKGVFPINTRTTGLKTQANRDLADIIHSHFHSLGKVEGPCVHGAGAIHVSGEDAKFLAAITLAHENYDFSAFRRTHNLTEQALCDALNRLVSNTFRFPLQGALFLKILQENKIKHIYIGKDEKMYITPQNSSFTKNNSSYAHNCCTSFGGPKRKLPTFI